MDRTGDQLTKELSHAIGSAPSLASNETRSASSTQDKEQSRSKGGGKRLLNKMHKIADWLSTSEPSAQALKQHKQEAFQKAGISPNDTEANAKLHAPIGQIPKDAIKPTTGPSPEEVARKRAEQRRKMKQQSASGSGSASASVSVSISGASGSLKSPSWSGYSSGSSPKESVSGPRDDDFGANGWGGR